MSTEELKAKVKPVAVVIAAILGGAISMGLIDQQILEPVCPPCDCAAEQAPASAEDAAPAPAQEGAPEAAEETVEE